MLSSRHHPAIRRTIFHRGPEASGLVYLSLNLRRQGPMPFLASSFQPLPFGIAPPRRLLRRSPNLRRRICEA